MKKNLLKLMLVAVFAMTGMSAWAAGYTRTLTDETEVAGYQKNEFYDFQNNTPEVLPTEGDLRYRDGGIWGLHNFGSGTRSATIEIPVKEGQLLVFQHYSASVVATIDKGTLNEGLTAATGYQCYDITTDGDNIKVTIARYGGIVAALLMDKDASAETADVIINYVDENGNTLKSETQVGIVGGAPAFSKENFWIDDVKYIYVSDDAEGVTVDSSGTVITVIYRVAETYNYSLVDNLGGTIATGSGYEGESVKVGYPRYKLEGNVFYSAATTNKEFTKSIALTEDNASATVEYTLVEDKNVVFYAEGEDIEGMTLNTSNNVPVRASNAKAGVATEDVYIATLSPAKYIIHAGIFTSKSQYDGMVMNFGIGSETFAAAFANVNLCEVASEEYTLTEESDVKFIAEGSWGSAQIDYIWIENTDGNGTVGIQTVNAAAQQGKIFNLQGQRVMNAQKGLYIQNGKKYVK